MTDEERYRRALVELSGIMDYSPGAEWRCPNRCEGCRHEMLEASRIVHNALHPDEEDDRTMGLTGHEGYE